MNSTYAADATYDPTRLTWLTRDPVDPLNYMYCVCCERAYQRGYVRVVSGGLLCPFGDCEGDAILDAHAWDWIHQAHPATFPPIPEVGRIYPLFDTEAPSRAA